MRILLLALVICVTRDTLGQSLLPYSSIVDRISIKDLEKSDAQSWDENGILLTNEGYHPAGIARYGILCLHEFVLHKDSSYYFKALDQVNYFRSDSLVHILFEGSGLGLPYHFEHKGLKPPWYSGMAQGMAASFLLRVYQYTQDPTLINIVKSVTYVMLQPEVEGGCISKTDEDYLWMEEYPNCPGSPQVLNGFIFALFGLIEYCEYFPSDQRANRLRETLLNSLKELLPTYDSRSWSRYNKRTIYPVREFYLRIQIFQMRHLYSLTQDPFFLRQMCIWMGMDYQQPMSDTIDFVHFDHHQFLVPAVIEGEKLEVQQPKQIISYDDFETEAINGSNVPGFPWYAFTTTIEYDFESAKQFEISLDTTITEAHIFYRYNWDKELFKLEKWQAKNAVSSNQQVFHLQPGTYQFAVFYKLKTDTGPKHDVYRFHFKDP